MKVSVSLLREFDFCSRAVYLKHVLKVNPKFTLDYAHALVGYAVRKELSLRQPRLLRKIKDGVHLEDLMVEEMENILFDLPVIYKRKLVDVDLEQLIPKLKREMKGELELMHNNLLSILKEYGFKRAVELLTPLKVEYHLKSESIGFSGVIDKIMEPLVPVKIKTGRVGGGVWGGDRLQLCAYGILLEEKFEQEIQSGFVEYTRVQEKRPVYFTENLRRKVLDARDTITEILSGHFPEICPHGNGRKCSACALKEECYKL